MPLVERRLRAVVIKLSTHCVRQHSRLKEPWPANIGTNWLPTHGNKSTTGHTVLMLLWVSNRVSNCLSGTARCGAGPNERAEEAPDHGVGAALDIGAYRKSHRTTHRDSPDRPQPGIGIGAFGERSRPPWRPATPSTNPTR
jgi:hypothetical protein